MTAIVLPYIRAFIILFFLSFSFLSNAEESVFQFVKAIGDERENYFLTKTGGIAFSDKKEIFIMDKKSFALMKYDWNGTFIARIGQRGRGPGDFLTPRGIQHLNNRLYIYDWLNHRLAVTGIDLAHFDYIKVHDLRDHDGGIYSIQRRPIVLDENRFLAVNGSYSPEKGRLFVFDKKQKVNEYFFCDLPTDLEDEKWRIKTDEEKRFLFNYLTSPIVGVNREKKQILITFEYPDTTMRFYLYSFSGGLIRKFSYRQDEMFRFPMQQLEGLMNTPLHTTWVLDILSCKDYYLVFMLQTTNRRRPDKKKNFSYLLISDQGKVLHRQEEKVRYLATTSDGYLAGVKWDQENDLVKIIISKLNSSRLSKMKPISSKSP